MYKSQNCNYNFLFIRKKMLITNDKKTGDEFPASNLIKQVKKRK